MKKSISILFMILFVLGCSSTEQTSKTSKKIVIKEKQKKYLPADKKVTDEGNVSSGYTWAKGVSENETPNELDIFRVDVSDPDNIKLYAHVLDKNNAIVSGALSKLGYKICAFDDNGRIVEEFEVSELSKEKIGNYDIAFALDHSGSIGEERAKTLQQSLIDVIDVKHSDDAFALTKFDHNVKTTIGLTSDKSELKTKLPVVGLQGFGGYTAMYNALNESLNLLRNSNRQKIIVIMSDGYDNSSKYEVNNIVDVAVTMGVNIFTIGFGSEIDSSRMSYIAKRTGGRFYHIHKSDEFVDVFEDIYRRLNHYYVINYAAKNKCKHVVKISICKKGEKELSDVVTFYNNEIASGCDLALSLEVRGVSPDGTEIYFPELTIWDRKNKDHYPLLPYIFFEDNSHKLAPRYKRRDVNEITGGNLQKLVGFGSKLDIYYDLLNIISERWHQNKDATITLTGCNSDIGNEKDNIVLSKKRADAVKSYLVNKGGIVPEKIKIEYRNRPEFPSGIRNKLAIEENRRVEISSDNPKILEPYIVEKTEYEVSPPVIRAYIDVIPKNEVKKWMVEFKKEDNTLMYRETFSDSPVDHIDYEISEMVKFNPNTGNVLITGGNKFLVSFCAEKNNEAATKCCMPDKEVHIIQNTYEEIVRKCIDYRQIETYNLILFNIGKSQYDDSEMEKHLMPILEKFKDKDIYVDISGHTDVIGSNAENKRLSIDRAASTAETMRKIFGKCGCLDAKIRNNRGYGEMICPQIYDNKYPEARMYCRTVSVTLYLPLPCKKR